MKVIEQARGKWSSILPMFGIDQDLLTGKHTACPCCGGKDRFRFSNAEGKGEFFCSQHGHGDGLDLIQEVNGWDFKTAARQVEKVVGIASVTEVKPKQTLEQKRGRLNNMRKRIKPFRQSRCLLDYLHSRGISEGTLSNITTELSSIQQLEYWNGRNLQGRYDAMIGRVKQLGKPITYHVTYLDSGLKANVPNPKKVMSPIERLTNGAIELFDYSHELGVAEGVETALSCYELFKVPTWAALNANSLQNFVIPEGVTKLHIFGDNDAGSMTGQKAAEMLRQKCEFQGVEAVEMIPSTPGFDWNDVLLEDTVTGSSPLLLED